MLSLLQFQLNQDKMNFSTLRNIQGLFAPLKLQMEFKAVQQVGVLCPMCAGVFMVALYTSLPTSQRQSCSVESVFMV